VQSLYYHHYEYKLIALLEDTFSKYAGVYYFLYQPFECGTEGDCDDLLALNKSGGLVNLFFEYIGDGKISLIE